MRPGAFVGSVILPTWRLLPTSRAGARSASEVHQAKHARQALLLLGRAHRGVAPLHLLGRVAGDRSRHDIADFGGGAPRQRPSPAFERSRRCRRLGAGVPLRRSAEPAETAAALHEDSAEAWRLFAGEDQRRRIEARLAGIHDRRKQVRPAQQQHLRRNLPHEPPPGASPAIACQRRFASTNVPGPISSGVVAQDIGSSGRPSGRVDPLRACLTTHRVHRRIIRWELCRPPRGATAF